MNQNADRDESPGGAGQPAAGSADPRRALLAAGYRLAVRAAAVTGFFSIVVAALLLVDFGRRDVEDPAEYPQYKELKAQLAERPQDESLKQAIRELDLQLRQEYFRQRRFTRAGAWLLLCGVVVFLVASKSAATLRQEPPMPEPQGVPDDTETKMTRSARWSILVLTLLLAAAAVFLNKSFRSLVPEDERALARLLESKKPTAGRGDTPSREPPVGPSGTPSREPPVGRSATPSHMPSDEEIAANWPRFRGPGGLGISNHENVPTTWDGASGDGILWKTPVPLPGNNSPVLWDDRVFLSGATEAKQEVYCFDTDAGELLWQQQIPLNPQAAAEPPEVMEDTGYAAPTTATDGRRVYAMFATGDVAAVDFAGELAWTRSLGVPDNAYGHASSLAMYRNLLLIQLDQGSEDDDKSKMLALDGATGETVWEASRDVANSWPSPIVAEMPDGSHQLITASAPWVIAYNPADGRELWRSKSLEGDVGPSPVVADGIVYVANEWPGMSAIRADGTGDVTESHVLWTGEESIPDTTSPLATDQHVFVAASYGILTCYDATSGEMLWDKEFDLATFTSSPSLVGGRIYLFDVEGKSWVVEPGPEGCKPVGEASLGEECVTSPAFRDGRLYIRGKQNLFCIK